MPYASDPTKSRGRLYKSVPKFNDVFKDDVNRILHSSTFRRLAYKTQVFVNDDTKEDYHRTRLTHSLDVAQIGKIIAQRLGVSESLTEAICLVHDFGHPPFGHAGEKALIEVTQGNFDHNIHCFKLVTELEEHYINYNGLNLSCEVLEGIVKHNGHHTQGVDKVPLIISQYNNAKQNLDLDKFPSLEAQISYVADDIAYHSHDIEDGLRAGLFSLEELGGLKIIQEILLKIDNEYGKSGCDQSRLIYKIIRDIATYAIEDVIASTSEMIRSQQIQNLEHVRLYQGLLVRLSEDMWSKMKELRQFLHYHVYQNAGVLKQLNVYTAWIKVLYDSYLDNPKEMPLAWQKRFEKERRDVVVADYIAGMTDGYAIRCYSKLS